MNEDLCISAICVLTANTVLQSPLQNKLASYHAVYILRGYVHCQTSLYSASCSELICMHSSYTLLTYKCTK